MGFNWLGRTWSDGVEEELSDTLPELGQKGHIQGLALWGSG